ncbi:MAG: hypothetical protein ACREXX_15285 [Gammaproteobacteria bacterium]
MIAGFATTASPPAGRIDSPGRFERTERGWRWRTDRAEVTLGEVTVFDATGARLPATLAVSATETRLTVDGPGKDRLEGGPGVDLCDGGPNRDQGRACEVRKDIP